MPDPDRPTLRGYFAARRRRTRDVRARLRGMRRRVALWQQSTAAFAAMLAFLIGHEVLYHLTDGTDYPVVLLTVDGHEILPISHGGLDVIGAGLLTVLILLARERRHERRPT